LSELNDDDDDDDDDDGGGTHVRFIGCRNVYTMHLT